MAAKRILVVEDDAAIRRGIVDALRFAGYAPIEAGTFAAAVTELAAPNPIGLNLMLVDLVLPGGSGLELITQARRVHPTLPIIAVTALGSESNRVDGLGLGADDYVVKPFSLRELLARIDAVIRRSAERPSDVTTVAVPGAVVDLARREVRRSQGGGRVELSENEAALFSYLARNEGRAISRDELLARVWKLEPSAVTTRTIDMTVARLREKLGPEAVEVILTVRGKGYMMALRAAAL